MTRRDRSRDIDAQAARREAKFREALYRLVWAAPPRGAVSPVLRLKMSGGSGQSLLVLGMDHRDEYDLTTVSRARLRAWESRHWLAEQRSQREPDGRVLVYAVARWFVAEAKKKGPPDAPQL